MAITIRDVARQLGLSTTTVSRALDGYDDVAEETRATVIQTAAEMGYAPNQAARQLRRKRADAIGYILPAEAPRFSDPFFAEFIAGMGDQAARHGYDLLVSTASPSSKTEQETYARWLHSRKVDGMVLNRMRLQDWRVQFLAQNGFPFVTFERSRDPYEYPSVEVDEQHWFSVLVDHLVSCGHERIAYIGGPDDLKIEADRFAGFTQSMTAHELIIIPELVIHSDLTTEGGYKAATNLLHLDRPPTAIACINDTTAIGVLHASAEFGLAVGRDLAVAGFDGVEGFEHTLPPLTTINQPIYQIACQLVQMLADTLSGNPLSEQHVVIKPVLEIRQSTGGQT